MALATLSIDLVAKLGELQAGMDRAGRIAEKSAAQIESRFAAIKGVAAGIGAALAGAVSVEGLRQYFLTTVNGLDALNDLADATGSTIENLSGLEDVAARTGTTLETVGTALVKLNKALGDAKPGSPQAAALKAIGLEADALKQLDPSQALLQVAIALNGYADDSNKARLVQELFGKSLKEVAPLLKDLAESGRINAKVTAEQAAEAERFNKQLDRLAKNSVDTARAIVGDILPALNSFIDKAREASNTSKGFEERLALLFGAAKSVGFGALIGLSNEQRDGLKDARAELEKIEAALKRTGLTDTRRAELENKRIGRLETINRLLNAQNYSNEGRNNPKPSVGDQPDPKARQAQLDALLADFQRQFGLQAAAISAGEQVLQANRGANLLEDKAYYDAKRALIKADESVQITALQNEIGALADYKAKVGNAIPEEQQIGIQRQIADKAAKISEIRIKAGAAIVATDKAQEQSVKSLNAAFEQAQASAEVYLGKLFEAQQADLQGQGQGDAQRRRAEGALAIERDYKSQIEALDQQRIAGRFINDQTGYAKELQLIEDTRAKALGLYDDYYAQLEAKQANASLGAQRAIDNYLASAKDVAAQTEQAYTSAFQGLEDSLVEFSKTGKLNFKSLADSIIADLVRIQIKAQISSLFGNKSGDSGGGGGLLGAAIGLIGSFFGGTDNSATGEVIRGRRAMGGPVEAGLPYLVGEKGPEIVVPRAAGTVIPNGKTLGGGTQITYAPVFSVTGPVPQETMAMIRAEVSRSQTQFARQLRTSGAIT